MASESRRAMNPSAGKILIAMFLPPLVAAIIAIVDMRRNYFGFLWHGEMDRWGLFWFINLICAFIVAYIVDLSEFSREAGMNDRLFNAIMISLFFGITFIHYGFAVVFLMMAGFMN